MDKSLIPTTDARKYQMIHNACRFYNNKMEDIVKWNDITETLDMELEDNGSKLLILAYCLKRITHENLLTEFTSVWSGFTKDVGIKDYNATANAKLRDIERTEHKIDELITNIEGFTIM